MIAQKTTTGDGTKDKNSVEIADEELTYRHGTIDPRVVRELSGEIERREVNQYTIIDTQHRTFESTTSSNDERDGALLLSVAESGQYHVSDLHTPEANVGADPNTRDARRLWRGDWEKEIVDGIRVKTVRSWSDIHESGSKRRTKIDRKAVEKAHDDRMRLFAVEYESRKGSSAGSRGNESRSWNDLTTVRVLELVPSE